MDGHQRKGRGTPAASVGKMQGWSLLPVLSFRPLKWRWGILVLHSLGNTVYLLIYNIHAGDNMLRTLIQTCSLVLAGMWPPTCRFVS